MRRSSVRKRSFRPACKPPWAGSCSACARPERARYEKQLNADPARSVGQRLIDDMMRLHNVDAQTALKLIEKSYQSAREKHKKPRAGAGQKSAPAARKSPEAMAKRIRQEVGKLKLPEGFDFEESVKDMEFVKLLASMPPAAAIRVYHAEQQAKAAPMAIAEKLMAREQLPRLLKPAQQGTPEIDYFAMSDEAFFELERRIKKARSKGIKFRT